MSMPSSSCLFRNHQPPKATKNHRIRNREKPGCWHAALGMKCFTCGAAASPALPLSPRAFCCLHGISQAAPRPNMHCHRRRARSRWLPDDQQQPHPPPFDFLQKPPNVLKQSVAMLGRPPFLLRPITTASCHRQTNPFDFGFTPPLQVSPSLEYQY